MSGSNDRRWPAVMVDLETLGTSDEAAILEVGAVCFDLESRTMGPALQIHVSLKSNGKACRAIEADTLSWWMDQWRERGGVPDLDDEAYAHDFHRAMEKFHVFWDRFAGPDSQFWSRGSFDERILSHALRQAALEVPWKYYKARDQRSVLDWEGIRTGPAKHNALDDASEQVKALFRAVDYRQGCVKKDQGEALEAVEAFADLLIQRARSISTATDHGGLKEIVLKDLHFTSGDEACRFLRDALLRRHEAKEMEVRVRLLGEEVREDWKPEGGGGVRSEKCEVGSEPPKALEGGVERELPLPDVARFTGSLVSMEDLRELFLCALAPVSALRASEMKMRLMEKYPGLMKEMGFPGNGLGQDAAATMKGGAA